MQAQSFFRQCLSLCLVLLTVFSFAPSHAAAWGEFTLKDEKELGDKFDVLIRSRMPLVLDSEVLDYVTDVVNRLASSLPPQPFPFTVNVIQHNAVNAFACPGGYIFVHTGLLLAMSNESEVAGVIAHEMAHVTQRHIARSIENSQWISLLSVIGALAGAFIGGDGGSAAMTGAMAAAQTAMLSYSRGDEREADQVGMNYLTKAGYPPTGMVGAFQVLSRRQWLVGSDIPSYLSTHPGLVERVKDMGIRVSRMPKAMQNRKDDNDRFLRVQALVRARYSDPKIARQAFARQMNGPARCVAFMGQGILASRQNRVKDAAENFDAALACAPGDPLIVREAGRFHYTKGDKIKGGDLLKRAVSMNRHDTFSLFYYARHLADSGRTAEAVDYARQVLRKVPEDAEVHELLARLYGRGNDLFRANLHMAYSGLYNIDKKKVEQFHRKAKGFARTPEEKAVMERFDKIYKERKEYWE